MRACVAVKANTDASFALSACVEWIAFVGSKVAAVRIGGAASSAMDLRKCVALLSHLVALRTRPSFVALAGVGSGIADASDTVSTVLTGFTLRSSRRLCIAERTRVPGIETISKQYPSSHTQMPPSAVEHTP